MAAGTVRNSANLGSPVTSSGVPNKVRVITPRRYIHPANSTTAQDRTRSPVKTPWIMSFSSWKILNFSSRTIRPRRASFSIFNELNVPASDDCSDSAAAVPYVIPKSTIASTTHKMSNQLQYQSAPRRYSCVPNTYILTRISPMKKTVKEISNTCHTGWSGSMSALRPATTALVIITRAGMTSNSSRKIGLSSDSSSSIHLEFCRL
mmetsp:Transcript_60749/g.142107  ORF Transcript_60749/g.142107 Transcript_60749/m.142107 type:complete len:206 (+) Transcript_60749:821-1438(+)